MSYQPLWLRDLVAYSIQAAALVGVGVIMASLLRLRVPRVRLAYWQALLALCVFLPLLQPWRPEVLETSGSVLSNVTFTTSATVAPSGPSLAEMILWVICAGIVLRAAWMALGLGRLWLYRRHAQRIERVPQPVEEAQRLAPVFPALFISRQLPTPATFGFFRPAILFPARFLEMEPPTQKAIALHELLHVERRDWLWNMFEEVVLTLLWFHLPLWWVVRSARLSREQVVDAEAVRRSKARRPYLKALLEMAGQKSLAESLPAPLFLRESQLAERVALMMKEAHMSRKQLTVSILAAAGVLLIAGTSLVWAFPLKTTAPQAEAPALASAAVGAKGAVAANASSSGKSVAAESEPDQKIGKVYKVGGKVKAPGPIYKPEPPYTHRARKAHLSGTVVLWAVIDAKGRVISVKEHSRPLGQGLDESAMNTVRSWKFNPGMREGVPVPVRVMVEISFRLYGKDGEIHQKPSSAIDPAQSNQNAYTNGNNNHNTNLNQDEIQRQVDQAMAQAKIAQQAAAKINQAEIQRQVRQAMAQAKIAQQAAAKLNQPEMQRQMQEAMKQAKIAELAAAKMNTPEMRRQMQEAMKQAQIAQGEVQKLNSAEVRLQLKQAQDELQAARKQLEQAREQLKTERLELRKNREAAKPLPPAPPKPASRASKPVPPAPPASPPPPPAKPPQSAGVVGGVPGGQVGGVPGGIPGGVSGAPPPPPASPSPEEVAPPPPPPPLASAPPPQNQ